MNLTLFQWLAIVLLGSIIVGELWSLRRGFAGHPVALARLVLWSSAMAAIVWPDLPQWFADALGIRRAADLVSYLFILAFLATSLHFYARCVRLERHVTELVRHLAIQEAQSPSGGSTPPGRATDSSGSQES